ncbi:hypothetical protein PYW07_012862 [Mythimna separata]|uniref:Uncharacterized protein n=1 Tax=Mythimna separata TaxID=271217 RepID=A0AAD7Y8S1_MYTSE|nr:hypothetical protein PYW07_012862 [Mythimna separata]
MRVCTGVLLLGIFAYTHSLAPNVPIDNKRSVNLALETVLEFSDRDKAGDIKFLDNVQNFISKVKTVINNNSNVPTDFRRDFKTPTVDTITDFIQEAIKTLNTYDNTTFKDFFDILDEEIRKYHYRGCKFYELMENHEIRKMIAAKLDALKTQSAEAIKADIKALSEKLTNGNYDKNVTEIVNYIDSLYRQDARKQLQKVISELEAHGNVKPKSNTKLREIIKNAVRSVVFDHYTNLNANVRRDVKQKIDSFWKRFNPNTDGSNNIINKVKKSKLDSRKHIANIEVEQSDYKEAGKKREIMRLDKKRYKHVRKDNTDEPLKGHDKVKKILSPKYTGATFQKRIKSKHQGESSDSESLEFYREPTANAQQNRTKQSKKLPLKASMKSKKKSEKKIVNLTTRISKGSKKPNIWIEESTGRLPKEVLDKLADRLRGQYTTNTARGTNDHSSKKNNKYGKGRKSWHGKMYERKGKKMSGKEYNKKYQNKHITEHETEKDSLSTQDSSQTSSENTEHKYDKISSKKSKAPVRMESKHAERSSAAAKKTPKYLDVPIPAKSVKAVKPPRGGRTAKNKKLAAPARTQRVKYDDASRMKPLQMTPSKKNIILSRKFQASPDQGPPVDRLDMKNKKHQLLEETVNSLEKDLFVIKKIKNLEREIAEVKSKLNDKTKETGEIRNFSETKTGADGKKSINNSIPLQKQYEKLQIADNKTVANTIENKPTQQITSKYNDTKDNIENIKSKINVNANEMKLTEVPLSGAPLKLDQKSYTNQYVLPRINSSVPETKPNPGQTEITGTEKDKSKIGDVMKTGKNINDIYKMRDGSSQITGTANNNKDFLNQSVKDKDPTNLDNVKQSEGIFRADGNMISNNFNDRIEETNSITDDNININEKNKNFQDREYNSIDSLLKSETNFWSNPNIEGETKQSKMLRLAGNRVEKNNVVKVNVKENKSNINVEKKTEVVNKLPQYVPIKNRRPDVNRFIMDMPEYKRKQIETPAGNITIPSAQDIQKTYFEKIALKYDKMMNDSDIAPADSKTNTRTNVKKEKHKQEPNDGIILLQNQPGDLDTIKLYKEFEELKNKLFNESIKKPSKGKRPKTKESKLRVGNEHESNAVNKQSLFLIDERKTDVNLNIGEATPVYRAGLQALEAAGIKNGGIKPTAIPTKATKATSKAAQTVVVTFPNTSNLSTMEGSVPQAPSLESMFGGRP